MTNATVQKIFLMGYAFYDQMHRIPAHIRKASRGIMVCRTALLGGHTQACPDGHYQRNWYNSCKHRMCPLCAFTQIERWLAKKKSLLLNTDHFHVIFTISHELHLLWRYNTELMSGFLFKSATETLFELLADEKYLGARPGIIASLHTWSKTLTLHPHLHCLVSACGVIKKEFKSVSKNYLLPFRVVREKFKGKFLDHIRKALNSGDLVLPDGMRKQQVDNLLNKLGRKKWNVHFKETYSHGRGVLIYLARYLRGGPISNKRIVRIKDGKVIFNYGRRKRALITLSVCEFIERFVQHVPGKNSIRVRSYGLYHHSCKDDLSICRMQLNHTEVEDLGFIDWQKICEEQGELHPELCPVCGKRLIAKCSLPAYKNKNQLHSAVLPVELLRLAA